MLIYFVYPLFLQRTQYSLNLSDSSSVRPLLCRSTSIRVPARSFCIFSLSVLYLFFQKFLNFIIWSYFVLFLFNNYHFVWECFRGIFSLELPVFTRLILTLATFHMGIKLLILVKISIIAFTDLRNFCWDNYCIDYFDRELRLHIYTKPVAVKPKKTLGIIRRIRNELGQFVILIMLNWRVLKFKSQSCLFRMSQNPRS